MLVSHLILHWRPALLNSTTIIIHHKEYKDLHWNRADEKINQFTNNPWWFTSNSSESTLTAVKARALLYSAVKGRQRGGPTIIYRENTFCAKFCLQQPLKVGPADFQKLMYKQRWRKRQWSREAITWLGTKPPAKVGLQCNDCTVVHY